MVNIMILLSLFHDLLFVVSQENYLQQIALEELNPLKKEVEKKDKEK